MKTLLWLDDCRNPDENNWLTFSPISGSYQVIWVKSYNEFVYWIKTNGLPTAICFDHDLADVKEIPNSKLVLATDWEKEYTGYDCAKWLVDYCIDNTLQLPLYNIQSANPVGKENIDKLLKNFLRFNSI
jgi:hypothetical protein